MPEPDTTTTTTTTTAPWFATFDDATKAHMTAKGYDKLEPGPAFLAAHQAYKEAESKLGIPADRVLKFPDAADADGWKALHIRLGVPPTPTEYDFSSVRQADGKPLDEGYVGFLRDTAHKLNVTKDAALGWAKAFVEREGTAAATKAATDRVTLGAEQSQLDAEWGAGKLHYEFLVERGAAMLGYTPADLAAIKSQPGFATKLKGFLAVAQKMGEAPLVGGDTGSGFRPGQMTPEQAVSRYNDIVNGRDKDFVARRAKGEKAATDEWASLTALVTRARMAGINAVPA